MRSTFFAVVLLSCLPLRALASIAPDDLVSLSLEELMDIEVILGSRTERRIHDVPAAIHVLQGAHLRQSGVRSLAEALRWVPGMQVGRIDANKWAISARGFSDRFAQKLLILIDGREVYSPLFSGVHWEAQDVLLEDVDRIEIIRGPGATLWGANAVNGIVNVVTRPATETRGRYAQVGLGSEERGFVGLRWGGRLGGTPVRVWAKAFRRDAAVDADGIATADDWRMERGGFRADWRGDGDAVTLQGAAFGGRTGETFRSPVLGEPYLIATDVDTDWAGLYLLGRWRRDLGAGEDVRLQVHYSGNRITGGPAEERRHTFDADLQHRSFPFARHDMIWGLAFRITADETVSTGKFSFAPADRTTRLWSGFLQDEISLVPDYLRLTLGSKLERNDYTGFEVQPNARILFRPRDAHTLWGAVSRAVRTPARADSDIRIDFRSFPAETVYPDLFGDGAPPVLISIRGNEDFESEVLLAYEAGYRLRPRPNLLFDVVGFYNVYDRLRAGRNGLPVPAADGSHILAAIVADNLMEGRTVGGEAAIEWHFPRGRLRGAYAYLWLDLERLPGANLESDTAERASPRHQFYLWPAVSLRRDVQLSAVVRYVGRITDRPATRRQPYDEYLPRRHIPAYAEIDLHLAWAPDPRLELSLVGQNLLHRHHPEYADFFIDSMPTEAQRGVYGALTWRQ
jgi:iron complex outermembrane receptor protein